MTLLTIRLLGNPIVTYGEQILAFRTRKVLALLIYLVVEKGLHSRESLMTLLWPNSTAKDGAATLRVTISRLRKSLQLAGEFLITNAGKVGFDFDQSFDLDVAWLATAVSSETLPNELITILDLDQGEFLTGFSLPDAPGFDNWVTIQREACQQQTETIYERLSHHLIANNNSKSAVTTAIRWLTRSPLSEPAYRCLMTAQSLAGDRPAALKTYDRCRAMLQQEFNIEPTPETVDLAARIKNLRLTNEDSSASLSTSLRLGTETSNRQSKITNRQLALPFIGRATEHNQLVTTWGKVIEGGTHIVTIVGAAGIGKTRLANAFQEWVTLNSPDSEIWQGRAFEMGGRLAYQPIVEPLRLRLEQENAPEDLLDDVWLAELSQLMPDLRVRYPDLPLPMSGEAHFVRSRFFEAVATLGSALAARNPVVFVLDDMQWADADTLNLVYYIARQWVDNRTPILLLLTVREENIAADAALRKWLTGVGQELPLVRLLLDSLNKTAVQQLVNRLAIPASDKKVTDAFGDWLWKETGGLPFFIEGMIQTLAEENIVTPVAENGRSSYDFAAALTQINSRQQMTIPPTVREAILAHLARLPEAASALILAASVLGRECGFERLCQVADLDELAALAAMEVLLNGRLLTEDSSAQRPYLVAHDYIREVVYSESREARRRIYHRRALIALEAEQAPAIECAFHALASRLDEPAFRFSLAAGDEALAECAFHEGLAHYDRALTVAQRLAGTAVTISPQSWLTLYQKRGRVLELVYDYAGAQANYEEMLEMGNSQHDQTIELAALLAQCIIHATSYSPLFNYQKAQELGLVALTLARKLDNRESEVKALRGLTSAEINGSRSHEKALAYAEKALLMARELDLKEQTGYMLGNLALIFGSVGQFAKARKSNNEAQSIWTALGNQPMLADVLAQKMGFFMFTGDYKTLVTLAHESLQLNQSIGNVFHQRMAWQYLVYAHTLLGQFSQAYTNLKALETNDNKSDMFVVPHAYFVIRFYLLVGALDQAEFWANKLYALYKDFIPQFHTLFLAEIARAKIAQGKLDQGEAILEQAFEAFASEGRIGYGSASLQVTAAYFQMTLANPERALDHLAPLIQHLHQNSSHYHLAEALWLQGKANHALGRHLAAKEALVEARTVAEHTGERTMLWQILALLSKLETQSGNKPEAGKLRVQAQEIISFITEQAGSNALRDSFLARADVHALMN